MRFYRWFKRIQWNFNGILYNLTGFNGFTGDFIKQNGGVFFHWIWRCASNHGEISSVINGIMITGDTLRIFMRYITEYPPVIRHGNGHSPVTWHVTALVTAGIYTWGLFAGLDCWSCWRLWLMMWLRGIWMRLSMIQMHTKLLKTAIFAVKIRVPEWSDCLYHPNNSIVITFDPFFRVHQ